MRRILSDKERATIREKPISRAMRFHDSGYSFKSGHRTYEAQPDGSWRVYGKPRSRVKRLREQYAQKNI